MAASSSISSDPSEKYLAFFKCYVNFLMRQEGLLPNDPKYDTEHVAEFTKHIRMELMTTALVLQPLFNEKIDKNYEDYTRDWECLCDGIAEFASETFQEQITDWKPLMRIIAFCGELVLRFSRDEKYAHAKWVAEGLASILNFHHDNIMELGSFHGFDMYCKRIIATRAERSQSRASAENVTDSAALDGKKQRRKELKKKLAVAKEKCGHCYIDTILYKEMQKDTKDFQEAGPSGISSTELQLSEENVTKVTELEVDEQKDSSLDEQLAVLQCKLAAYSVDSEEDSKEVKDIQEASHSGTKKKQRNRKRQRASMASKKKTK